MSVTHVLAVGMDENCFLIFSVPWMFSENSPFQKVKEHM